MNFTKIKENYKINKLLYNCILIAVLFFVNCFLKEFVWVVYAVLLAMVMFDNLENGLTYLVFAFPFYLIRSYLSTIIYFTAILLFLIKFFIVVYAKDKNKFSKLELIAMGLFLIYILLPFGKYNLNTLLKVSALTFLLIFASAVSKKTEILKIDRNIRVLAYALIVSSLFSFTTFISPWLYQSLGKMDFSHFFRFQAMFNNVNTLAMCCEITLGVLASLIITKNKLVDWILFVVISALGIVTFSKTFIILWCLIVLILFIAVLKKHTKKTLIISAVVLGIFMVGCICFPKILIIFKDRFFGTISNCHSFTQFMDMITTERYSIWVGYSTYIFTNPLVLFFGKGLGAYRLPGLNSTHNVILAMLYQLGIVGIALFIFAIVAIVRASKKTYKTNKFNKAFIIPFVIIALILQVEDMIFFMINLG